MPDYFYAFFPKDEPDKTLCVATSITGGLATAETVSGIPKGQISLRAIDRETFLQLAPDATKSSLIYEKPHDDGMGA